MEPERAESVAPLALLAMRDAGAEGYAIYCCESNSPAPVRVQGYGLAIPEEASPGLSTARFRLCVEGEQAGILAFVFRAPVVPETSLAVLERLARTIESVWSLSHASGALVDLTTHIGRLQSQLADLKIADRAGGFLAHPQPNASLIMAHHVESVLNAHRFRRFLEEMVRDLENQIRERRLITRAKALLQDTYGISEEQAHARLRLSSRRSRRRLGTVAEHLIKEEYGTPST